MDAPEKIWIDVEPYELHWHEGEPPAGYVHARGPYTRTDRANELVAAAYEAAARVVSRAGHSLDAEIRSLTPADAAAALAARDARIREAALREAADAGGMWFGFNSQGEPTGDYCTVEAHDPSGMLRYVRRDKILALIAKDKA